MSFRKVNLGIIGGQGAEKPAEKRKRACCGNWQKPEVEQCPWSGSWHSTQGVGRPAFCWESWAPEVVSQFTLPSVVTQEFELLLALANSIMQ